MHLSGQTQSLRQAASAVLKGGEAERDRRFALGSLGLLGAGEVGVAVASPLAGGFLLACTGALVFFGHRRERALTGRQGAAETASDHDAVVGDGLTDLPGRIELLEQLAREAARAQRYGGDLTLAIVQVARMAELRDLWGERTAGRAIELLAETLRRVTRTSDYVARLDGDRFAVLLSHCTAAQAALFNERLTLAVGNRPLPAREHGRLPLYVGAEFSALQYDTSRFRGPLDFLSAAGGDVAVEHPAPAERPAATAPRGERLARPVDGHALRRQLIRDYYPEGKAKDFAAAYADYRGAARRAG